MRGREKREAKSRFVGDLPSERRHRIKPKGGHSDDESKGRSRGKGHARGHRKEEEDSESPSTPVRHRRDGWKDMPPIFKAIAEDDLETLEIQIDKKSPLPPTFRGCSPLSFAAKLGSLKLVKFLLKKGVAVDGGSMDKMTPLQHAVKMDRKDIVVALLAQNANVRLLSSEGKTAWEYAAHSEEMKTILRVHGSKSLQTPPTSTHRRSIDHEDDRTQRSESWSGPRLNTRKIEGEMNDEKRRRRRIPSGRSASRPREIEGKEGGRRSKGDKERKEERSASRARREKQRQHKGEPRKPRPPRRKTESGDESGESNPNDVAQGSEDDAEKEKKGSKPPYSPKSLEALELELIDLIKEEQEQVLKTENRLMELKAEMHKLQGQLKKNISKLLRNEKNY